VSKLLFNFHTYPYPANQNTSRNASFFYYYRYFTFLTECTTPKACTILLRGPSKDILNEIDRNLADAMSVARNVVFNPTLVPGGGAVEMAISVGLHARARAVTGVEAAPFRAVADALEVIPRTLVQNAGGNAIRALTALRVRLFPSLAFFPSPPFLFSRQNMRMVNIRGVSMARRVIS
jgi:chaperonin GroEL (HSP60 family)